MPPSDHVSTETTTTKPARQSAHAERIEHLVRLATDAFAEHEICSRTETSIVIRRRNSDGSWGSYYATEIVAGALAHLIVTGDVDTVVFARESGSLRSRLGWIAPKAERDPSWRYLVEKATIGMTCNRKLSTEFAAELAEDLIADLAQDAEAEGDDTRVGALREIDPPGDESEIGAFLEALEDAGISDVWEYWNSLHEVAPRVVYAWAACRKAAELLDAADAAAQQAAREVTKASSEVVAGSTPIAPTNPETGLGGDHG